MMRSIPGSVPSKSVDERESPSTPLLTASTGLTGPALPPTPPFCLCSRIKPNAFCRTLCWLNSRIIGSFGRGTLSAGLNGKPFIIRRRINRLHGMREARQNQQLMEAAGC